MRAGDLDRTVTIESASIARSQTGAEDETWSTLDTVRARRIDQAAREFLSAGAEVGEDRAVFKMYWRTDVTRKMRVVDGADNWDIERVQRVERTHWMMLHCKLVA